MKLIFGLLTASILGIAQGVIFHRIANVIGSTLNFTGFFRMVYMKFRGLYDLN